MVKSYSHYYLLTAHNFGKKFKYLQQLTDSGPDAKKFLHCDYGLLLRCEYEAYPKNW